MKTLGHLDFILALLKGVELQHNAYHSQSSSYATSFMMRDRFASKLIGQTSKDQQEQNSK